MTTIIDKETNQEFEILGTGNLGKPTHYITVSGDIVPANFGFVSTKIGITIPLRVINKQHTFGDLVLEETGEDRVPEQGEWYLSAVGDIYPMWQSQPPTVNPPQGETYANRIILRHICGGEV